MTRIVFPLVAAAALGLLAAPHHARAAATPAPAAVVDTVKFAYTPETVTVKAGDTVLFKNDDSTAHTILSEDKGADGKALFDSGNMDQGQTWAHVFAKAGTYKYVCAYHAFMRGTVIVQ
jgi:plastocyanin